MSHLDQGKAVHVYYLQDHKFIQIHTNQSVRPGLLALFLHHTPYKMHQSPRYKLLPPKLFKTLDKATNADSCTMAHSFASNGHASYTIQNSIPRGLKRLRALWARSKVTEGWRTSSMTMADWHFRFEPWQKTARTLGRPRAPSSMVPVGPFLLLGGEETTGQSNQREAKRHCHKNQIMCSCLTTQATASQAQPILAWSFAGPSSGSRYTRP